MTPVGALPLAAGDGFGVDDVALIVFFVVVALLRLLQKALARRAPVGGGEEGEGPGGAAEREAPSPRGRRHPRAAPAPAPVPAARRAPPTAAPHLADLGGLAPAGHVALLPRAAEPSARPAAGPTGRALLLRGDLAPPDRLRQAVLWSEVLRRRAPVRPPPPRR